MKKKMLSKLRSQRGESIGETLVALLISSLALVMLAGAISSAARVITQSNKTMAEYYKKDNALAERASTDTTKVTISEAGNETSVDPQPWNVQYDLNDTFASTPVIAYSPTETTPPDSDG